jgi:histidinol-phosphate/aromatic aminotransferase/cobyric acid decarboxylase-like protein/GTP:adenosylcobinamide-phosphate guanylyltransferase
MQAIILAAGMGKRLGELTRNNTKCMVKVNEITLIDRVLSQLAKLHLKKVVIVVGYEGQKLIDFIGDRYSSEIKIEYVHNPVYEKTNNIYSLALAKKQLQEDDTLLIESDLIFDDSLFHMIVENPYPNLALVAKYETWMDGTMVQIDNDCNIVNFIPKKAFNYNEVDSYYKTVNIYKFSKEFSRSYYIPFLEAYSKALGNNEYYEQVLRVITLLDRTGLKALPLTDEKWYEIDDVQDLDIAETIFSEESKLQMYQKRYGGYWRFPKLIDFCYLVNPYFPSQRMKDELRANFDTLLTEYPSGMFVNALVAGKYFGVKQEYVVVGNGAAELIKSLMEKLEGNIGITCPTFEEYSNRIEKERIVQFIPQNADFSYSADDLIDFFTGRELSSLLLINPDNPSGNYIPMENVLLLANWANEENITLIVDESFVDFSDDYLNNSLLKNGILEAYPNLIVVKSISKSYGVPGLRLGVLVTACTTLIDWMKKDVSIWNINSFAEFYLQIFTKYEDDYQIGCEKFLIERRRFFNELQTIPFLRVIPSQANFFMCEVVSLFTSKELTNVLLNRFNILIKDCGAKTAFLGTNYIRIAIKNVVDNDKLLRALRSL